MKKVATKGILCDEFLQVAVRGHDYADIHFHWSVSANPFDFAFFQHAKQLGLHSDGHVSNFVQKERAAFGLFELADVAAGGSSECAFFVTEELGFD